MEKLFKEIALEENGAFSVTHQQSYTHLYLNFPLAKRENGLIVNSLTLKIPYKDNEILVEYKLADNHNATIECAFPANINISEFRVEKGNHIWNAIERQKHILKVKSDDSNLIEFINKKLIDLNLQEIANSCLFEPLIIGKVEEKYYRLSTQYHLAFPQKKEVLRPMICFYKDFIDKVDF